MTLYIYIYENIELASNASNKGESKKKKKKGQHKLELNPFFLLGESGHFLSAGTFEGNGDHVEKG